MNYYLLDDSKDSKEIGGVYPQGHCIDKTNNLVQIEKRAKLTDLLSITNYDIRCQLTLSEKAFDLLNIYWDQDGAEIKPIFFTKGINLFYYLIQINTGLNSIINVEECEFGVKRAGDIIDIIKGITTLEIFQQKSNDVFMCNG